MRSRMEIEVDDFFKKAFEPMSKRPSKGGLPVVTRKQGL